VGKIKLKLEKRGREREGGRGREREQGVQVIGFGHITDWHRISLFLRATTTMVGKRLLQRIR
jgi:hypothetical protein